MRRILCAGLGLVLTAGLALSITAAEAAAPEPGVLAASAPIDLAAGPAPPSPAVIVDLACVAAPATTLLPARVELPVGYRVSTPVDTVELGRLAAGTVLTRTAVTREPMRVPIDTGACGISHIPFTPLGQIDWFKV